MKNKILIIVVTTGTDLEEEFNVHNPLKVVEKKALEQEQPNADPNLFHLEYAGQKLDENTKIEDCIEQFGWEDGVILELVPQPVVI